MLMGIVKNDGEVLLLEGIGDTKRASLGRAFEAGCCLGVNENGALIEMVDGKEQIKAEPAQPEQQAPGPEQAEHGTFEAVLPGPKLESEQKQGPDGGGVV